MMAPLIISNFEMESFPITSIGLDLVERGFELTPVVAISVC